MGIRDYGFSPMIDDESTQRAEDLMEYIDDATMEQLALLTGHRRGYWEDLKRFAEQQSGSILRELEDGTITQDEAEKQLSLMAADLAQRMVVKFQLALVEILVQGAVQGPLPSNETERILR